MRNNIEMNKNSFVSSPGTLGACIFLLVFFPIGSICWLVFGWSSFLEQPLAFIAPVGFIVFGALGFLVLSDSASIIQFDYRYVYRYKGKKLVGQCEIEFINIAFDSEGYTVIVGTTPQGKVFRWNFEMNEKREKIIEKFYRKPIENMPKQYLMLKNRRRKRPQ